MTINKVKRWTIWASISCVWLLAPTPGHCFCIPEPGAGPAHTARPQADHSQYEHRPFGEVIRGTGRMAKANPLRFSTKYQDDETDLVYYGYRYNNASTGRWLSRDPIGERAGKNLYGFVANDPVRSIDALGRVAIVWPTDETHERDVDADITATLTVSDVCHGGPLLFTVRVTADYDVTPGAGPGYLSQDGISFGYGGAPTQATDFQYGPPFSFTVPFSKSLPICPNGRQSGSMDFAMARNGEPLVTITFDWHYKCDCQCKEVEPFKPSYTYFIFPPIKPPPPPKRPGRTNLF